MGPLIKVHWSLSQAATMGLRDISGGLHNLPTPCILYVCIRILCSEYVHLNRVGLVTRTDHLIKTLLSKEKKKDIASVDLCVAA